MMWVRKNVRVAGGEMVKRFEYQTEDRISGSAFHGRVTRISKREDGGYGQ